MPGKHSAEYFLLKSTAIKVLVPVCLKLRSVKAVLFVDMNFLYQKCERLFGSGSGLESSLLWVLNYISVFSSSY